MKRVCIKHAHCSLTLSSRKCVYLHNGAFKCSETWNSTETLRLKPPLIFATLVQDRRNYGWSGLEEALTLYHVKYFHYACGRSGYMPPRKCLDFWPSEIISGAIWGKIAIVPCLTGGIIITSMRIVYAPTSRADIPAVKVSFPALIARMHALLTWCGGVGWKRDYSTPVNIFVCAEHSFGGRQTCYTYSYGPVVSIQ